MNQTSNKQYITVFTGAGVSAESGVKTFRDNGGLWNNHRVEDVATTHAWKKNPQLVWDFYRQRYHDLKGIEPNQAHHEIVKLEQLAKEHGYKFLLITQNVDGLHLKAGSQNVVEIHGDLRKLRCEICYWDTEEPELWDTEEIPVCPICDNKLRVNVVWFGDMLPEKAFNLATIAAERSKIFLVSGTSGEVQPAAGLVSIARHNGSSRVYECNPTPAFYEMDPFYSCYRAKASLGIGLAVLDIKNHLINLKSKNEKL